MASKNPPTQQPSNQLENDCNCLSCRIIKLASDSHHADRTTVNGMSCRLPSDSSFIPTSPKTLELRARYEALRT